MKIKRKRALPYFLLLLWLTAAVLMGGCGGAGTLADQNVPDAGQVSDNKDVKEEASPDENAPDAGAASKQEDASKETEENISSNELTVQFLDVGQGSAALVHQDGHWMLIDGGDREFSSYVVSFLKQQGVEYLDYVVVSHYDADHLNGVVGVLNVFGCGQVLAPDYQGDTKVYASFCSVIDEKQIPLTSPKLGEEYAFAQSSFRVVSPASYEYGDANSNSLGIRLAYGSSSFLICGDCTAESEQDLVYLGVDLDSDVFAANHHGSRYSNSREFLEAVSPKAVVISCGLGNSYGHPDASVMLSIQELGADLYRTDLQGVITAVSDGTDVRFENEVCMDYRCGAELAGEEDKTAQESGNTETGSSGAGSGNAETDSGSSGAGSGNTEAGSSGAGSGNAEAGSGADSGNTETGSSGAGSGNAETDSGNAGSAEADSGNADSGSSGAADGQTEGEAAALENYVLNHNTKKFHKPSCGSVKTIKAENREDVQASRDVLLQQGYEPCKKCNP